MASSRVPNLNIFGKRIEKEFLIRAMSKLFGRMDRKKLEKQRKMSVDWLLKKFDKPTIRKVSTDLIMPGRMFLFKYNAKYADKLPYWDVYPVIMVVGPDRDGKGFYGVNFHYLHPEIRISLFNFIVNYRDYSKAKKNRAVPLSYEMLGTYINDKWKFAFKHYLRNYQESDLIEIPQWDWKKVVMLPIANFQNATEERVMIDSLLY